MADLSLGEVHARFDNGHRCYLASVDNTPVAYGWVATQSGAIDEIGLHAFPILPESRYLWDFQTLPAWRGQGIYPQLLQHIVRQEQPSAQRLYIGYVSENEASQRGITKAGFLTVGALVPAETSQVAFEPSDVADVVDTSERSQEAARFFQVPVVSMQAL
ncbi:GNAT family N-acetyltransferase [Ktedonobacteria bacterium brp13]|nr:GNAT family N-acetyltransferase [Ktedonobacteria bacterium brp13]